MAQRQLASQFAARRLRFVPVRPTARPRPHHPVRQWCSPPSYVAQRRWMGIHVTAPLQLSTETTDPAKSAETETPDTAEVEPPAASAAAANDDDEIPPWQNPLHHNLPDKHKVFKEDFGPDEEMPIVPLPPLNGEPPPHIKELADEILNLTLLEMKDLTDKVAVHFGFDDDVEEDSTAGGDVAAAPEEEEVKEEKTVFDLRLEGFDAKSKIKVIKEVRAIAGLGLKEAKELVEGAPKVVKKDIKPEEAEELKKKLEDVGAQVEIV